MPGFRAYVDLDEPKVGDQVYGFDDHRPIGKVVRTHGGRIGHKLVIQRPDGSQRELYYHAVKVRQDGR